MRSRLARWLLVPALLAVLCGVRLGWTLATDSAARADYADGRYAEAAEGFADNLRLPPLPTWRDRFNRADADFAAQRYPEARRGFEDVLDRVPEDRECQVRVNLALTHEALAGADPAQAQEYLRQGRDVLRAGDCTRAPDADQRRDARAADARLAARQQGSGTPEDSPDPPEDRTSEPDAAARQRLERLQERSAQAQRDAARATESERYTPQDFSGEQSW